MTFLYKLLSGIGWLVAVTYAVFGVAITYLSLGVLFLVTNPSCTARQIIKFRCFSALADSVFEFRILFGLLPIKYIETYS